MTLALCYSYFAWIDAMNDYHKKQVKSTMTDKSKKAIYETPVIIPLGELARGAGAACSPGSNPGTGAPGEHCSTGGSAGGQCFGGSNPSKRCKTGATN